MSGRYLLDTSIIIALFENDEIIKNNLAQASEVFCQVLPWVNCTTAQENQEGHKQI